jgi:anaerobic selenocysteine-containing dehydrogenase
VRIPRIDVPVDHFLLTSRRGRQFNSMTYGTRDPLLGGADRNAVLLDARDIEELGFHEGDNVRVVAEHGEMQATLRSAPCRRGHVQAYWPECNALVGRRYDKASGEPDYNTVVRIERAS